MNRVLALYGLAIIFLLQLGCNRQYEEGPFLSVFLAKDRLARDWNWVLARRTTDGVTENLTNLLTNSTLTINEDGTWQESRYGTSGGWGLISKKRELNIVFEPTGDSLGIPSPALAFDIRQLTKQDLWLVFEDSVEILEWQLIAK